MRRVLGGRDTLARPGGRRSSVHPAWMNNMVVGCRSKRQGRQVSGELSPPWGMSGCDQAANLA